MEGQLQEVFTAFAAGGSEMDGRSFVKCLRDSGLLDGSSMKIVDADLIFVKCKEKGARKIVFSEFNRALSMVSARKGLPDEETIRLICTAAAPHYETGSQNSSGVHSALGSMGATGSVVGPERFYYDKSTYTGTHRHGGPTVMGGGVSIGDVVRDSDLVNREVVLEDALHRKKSNGNLPVLLGGEKGDEAHTRGQQHAEEKGPRRSLRRPKSPVGPERFYYDKSTYTGTHRNGGPTNIGSGLSKRGGYEDLSQLVNRAHVQDDGLHRRKEEGDASPPPQGHRAIRSQPPGSAGAQGRTASPIRSGGGAGPLPEQSPPISAPPQFQSKGGYPAIATVIPPLPSVGARMPPTAAFPVPVSSAPGGYPAAHGVGGPAMPIPVSTAPGAPMAMWAQPAHAMAMAAVLAPQGHPMIAGPAFGARWAVPVAGPVAFK